MSQLRALTEPGSAMVVAAERFAIEFADGALEHDRSGSFATEHLDKLRADGYLVGPVPAELGGGGVTSVHDVLVASSRLARGDPATTIGVNMHLAVVLNLVRAWRVASARGGGERASSSADLLRWIVDDDVVFASAVSEPSPQDLTRPRTTAARSGRGWVVRGRKAFATMAPAASHLSTAVTYIRDDGAERYGFAIVPVDAPGVELHDDWDAVGMRASASGSVSLHGVRLEAGGVRDGFETGRYTPALLERFLVSGALHPATSLGIAEAAHERILAVLTRRPESVVADPHAMVRLAENVVDLAAARASLSFAGHRIDEYQATFPQGGATLADALAVTADVQAAKTAICAAAERITDRALALTGGAGYLAANPLAKSWRDARAGAFMHPFGVNRALDLLARTELGLPPSDG